MIVLIYGSNRTCETYLSKLKDVLRRVFIYLVLIASKIIRIDYLVFHTNKFFIPFLMFQLKKSSQRQRKISNKYDTIFAEQYTIDLKLSPTDGGIFVITINLKSGIFETL